MNKKAVIGPKDADNIALEPERLGPGAPGGHYGTRPCVPSYGVT